MDELEQRLDARRKAAAAPGQGDLFAAPKAGGGGQPCGASHIAPSLICHKGQGRQAAAAAPAKAPGGMPSTAVMNEAPATAVSGGGVPVGPPDDRPIGQRTRPGVTPASQLPEAAPYGSLQASVAGKQRAQDEQQQKRSSRRAPFLEPMPPMARSKAEAALTKMVRNSTLGYVTRQELIETRVSEGFRPVTAADGSRRLQNEDGVFLTERDITATGMKYAEHLVRPQQPKTVPAPPAQRGNVVPGVNAGPGFLGDISVPRRKAPAAAKPAPKPAVQEAVTPQQQAAVARDLAKEAAAAGDQKGAKAWEKENRTIERNRVAAAVSRQQTSQTGLFGVTEYDNTMPLFARRDAADPVGRMLQDVLAEQLPGSQVLDWEQHAHGVTSGRVAAEGLLYRFRCDGEGVGYRPAWDGLSERAWEARSQGFLEVRNGAGARMDFKKPKFSQLSSKRKCSAGYSCGSSCISLQKECRVTPKSAIGKQRLRQLAALAKEGDPLAQQKASGVEAARLQKAFELREKRDVDKLKKLRERPEIAEFLRTGKLPAATAGAAEGGGAAAGQRTSKVQDISPNDIEVDPERFQYKIKRNAAGEVGSLKGVQKWDENLAGVISVWEDPADGKTYVINGHNRLGLAQRRRAENVTVRYLDAPDAKAARAIGAMQNIAEGAGSEIDAAKFFRDSGIKNQQQVEEKGLPMNSGKAAKGLALAKLPPEMFNEVVQGNLSVGRGAIIGGSGLPMEKQREIGKMLRSRKSISDGTLDEYVQSLAVSETINQTTLDVFGNKETVDTGLTRAELANGLRRKLAKERSLFATVSRSRAAEALQEKAGNVINQAESATVASEADQVLRVFNQMKNESGPISSALNAAAARVQAGESAAAVRAELEREVIAGMQEELERAGLRQRPTSEAPTASLFDSITLEDRLAGLQQRLDARVKQAPGQMGLDLGGGGEGKPCGAGHIAPALTCHKGQGAMASTGQAEAAAQGPRRGSIADAMKQQIEAMKAADIRQMGMLAQQLFEASWQLDRKKKYKGMTKEEAKQDYLKEFAKKLQDTHERRASSAASAPSAQPAQGGSIAATMKGLLETMKASDQRLEQLSKDVVDLRIKASGLAEDDEPAGGITGRSTRRIGPSGRRDSQEVRIGRLIRVLSNGAAHAYR